MYAEGRGYLGDLITGTRNMGLEVIATLCANQITIKQQIEGARARQELARAGGKDLTSTPEFTKTKSSELHISPTLRRPETAEFKEDNLVLAHEIIRMLKLFYFCVVEHLRSSEGTPTWKFAHDKMRSFATRNEWRELLLEFGKVQPNAQRQDVKRTFHFKRFNAEDDVTLRVVQDPTRAKPLLVLAWVRMALERGVSEGLLRDQQLTSFSAGITKLGNAVGGTHKVDTMVLRFPCAAPALVALPLLLHSPFFVVTELDWATIPACMCITLVFYGLNEVGTELEQPFGVDPTISSYNGRFARGGPRRAAEDGEQAACPHAAHLGRRGGGRRRRGGIVATSAYPRRHDGAVINERSDRQGGLMGSGPRTSADWMGRLGTASGTTRDELCTLPIQRQKRQRS